MEPLHETDGFERWWSCESAFIALALEYREHGDMKILKQAARLVWDRALADSSLKVPEGCFFGPDPAMDAHSKHYPALFEIVGKRVLVPEGKNGYICDIIELTTKGDFQNLENALREWKKFTPEDIEKILAIMKQWRTEAGDQPLI